MASRSVTISDEVYAHIATQGRFGEKVDDVLRRLFGLETGTAYTSAESPRSGPPSGGRGPNLSSRRLSPRVEAGVLTVAIDGAGEHKWSLPEKSDTHEIRRVTHEALAWASERGATEGQLKHVRKEMSDNGYLIARSRRR